MRITAAVRGCTACCFMEPTYYILHKKQEDLPYNKGVKSTLVFTGLTFTSFSEISLRDYNDREPESGFCGFSKLDVICLSVDEFIQVARRNLAWKRNQCYRMSDSDVTMESGKPMEWERKINTLCWWIHMSRIRMRYVDKLIRPRAA